MNWSLKAARLSLPQCMSVTMFTYFGVFPPLRSHSLLLSLVTLKDPSACVPQVLDGLGTCSPVTNKSLCLRWWEGLGPLKCGRKTGDTHHRESPRIGSLCFDNSRQLRASRCCLACSTMRLWVLSVFWEVGASGCDIKLAFKGWTWPCVRRVAVRFDSAAFHALRTSDR